MTHPSPSNAEGTGAAVVQVVTEPELGEGTFRFSGVPGGNLSLSIGVPGSLTEAGLEPGNHVTKLSVMDPVAEAAGYTLVDIRCDDIGSTERSTGNLDSRTAIFRIEEGENVTCVFILQRLEQVCLCPKDGRWKVNNHAGSMVCTGAMNMTVPLPADQQSGKISIGDECAKFIGKSMSDGDAPLEMHLRDDCTYTGSVGGSQQGIPMVIEYTMVIQDEETITGELYSRVSQQGMTCTMTRTYDLSYAGQ